MKKKIIYWIAALILGGCNSKAQTNTIILKPEKTEDRIFLDDSMDSMQYNPNVEYVDMSNLTTRLDYLMKDVDGKRVVDTMLIHITFGHKFKDKHLTDKQKD